MIGQIQLLQVADHAAARRQLLEARDELLALANSKHATLLSAGGGAIDLEVHELPRQNQAEPVGDMLVLHLIVDVRDAMGANVVNSMCERLAPHVGELARGRVCLRILSNLSDRRTVVATGRVLFSALQNKGCSSPEALARGIEEASVFAERDPYRAATHNKGIMNGVDAVLLAFGQDWRAVEAGAHAFAAREGRYGPLARWRVREGCLEGRLEIPLAVGVVGGAAVVHPSARVARELADVASASDLARLTAALGLAQNLAALRALAAEGIQRGHMGLHARNIAVEAGARGDEVEALAHTMMKQDTISVKAARKLLAQSSQAREQTLNNAVTDPQQTSAHFRRLSEAHLPAVLALMKEVVQQSNPSDSALGEMCSYHLDTGGKRLRSVLPLLVAEALNADPQPLRAFAAACEMLHNATLVHDDLQDGDAVRRGRASVWAHFGEPQAINLGDAMFYYTLLLLQRLEQPANRVLALTQRTLLETLRVIDGQQRELGFKSRQSNCSTEMAAQKFSKWRRARSPSPTDRSTCARCG